MGSADANEFGSLLRQLRLAAGMTQEALAERANVSAKAIGELERNPSRFPRLDTVGLLSDALGLESEERACFLRLARPAQTPQSEDPLPIRVAGDLPRPPTPIFGRAEIIDELAELLRRASQTHIDRFLMLIGSGGVGKTRLAIAAAKQSEEAFSDGVLFVDLAALRDPSLVVTAIAQSLSLDERDKVPLRARLIVALRSKCLLLVLDNCEHLLSARDDLVALLDACPSLVVIATSRVAMRIRGERDYRVAPLEVPEKLDAFDDLVRSPAVALFRDRALAVGANDVVSESVPVVAEICQRLDGIPLAIELAAAWTRLLSPSELLVRLQRRLPLLIDGPPDLPARQRTMRDTISWSYDLLAPEDQQLFRRLCIFVGGCSLEAAQAVCAETTDESALMVGLASLVDRSLLRSEKHQLGGQAVTRLTLLETLREFGLEQLDSRNERDALQSRHATYCLAMVENCEAPNQRVQFERDHENIRAALAWSIQCGEMTTALRLASGMWRFWADRGYLSEGLRWLDAALELPINRATALNATRARTLIAAANLAIEQGSLDIATARVSEALDATRDLDDRTLHVLALNTQGVLSRQLGENDESARWFREALELGAIVEDHVGVADARNGLANAAMRMGNLSLSAELWQEALNEYRLIGDNRGIAETLKNLSFTALYAGAFERAEHLGNEAIRHLRTLGDSGALAEALWAQGVVAHNRGDLAAAEMLHQESLAIRRNRGDENGISKSLGNLGALALARGDFSRARELLTESLVIVRASDERHSQAIILSLMGQTVLADGAVTEARACLAESAELHRAMGNPLYTSWCLEGLAGLAVVDGRLEQAARLIGARAGLHAALGTGQTAAHQVSFDRALEMTRTALGPEAFDRAYDIGRTRILDNSLAEAIEDLWFGRQRRPALV